MKLGSALCGVDHECLFPDWVVFSARTGHQDVPNLLSTFHCPVSPLIPRSPSNCSLSRYLHFTDEETERERNEVGNDVRSH